MDVDGGLWLIFGIFADIGFFPSLFLFQRLKDIPDFGVYLGYFADITRCVSSQWGPATVLRYFLPHLCLLGRKVVLGQIFVMQVVQGRGSDAIAPVEAVSGGGRGGVMSFVAEGAVL